MATPKKKVSRSRRDMRRYAAHNMIDKPTISTCPNCNEPSRPHRVCRCGFYNGKSVLPGKTTEAQA